MFRKNLLKVWPWETVVRTSEKQNNQIKTDLFFFRNSFPTSASLKVRSALSVSRDGLAGNNAWLFTSHHTLIVQSNYRRFHLDLAALCVAMAFPTYSRLWSCAFSLNGSLLAGGRVSLCKCTVLLYIRVERRRKTVKECSCGSVGLSFLTPGERLGC